MSSGPRPSMNIPEALLPAMETSHTMKNHEKSLRNRVSGKACSRSWACSLRSCQRIGRFSDYLNFYLLDKKKEARLEELLKEKQ